MTQPPTKQPAWVTSLTHIITHHHHPSLPKHSPRAFHSPIPQTNDDARSELTAQLEDLLNTLSNKLAGVSSEIFAKSRLPLPLAELDPRLTCCHGSG